MREERKSPANFARSIDRKKERKKKKKNIVEVKVYAQKNLRIFRYVHAPLFSTSSSPLRSNHVAIGPTRNGKNREMRIVVAPHEFGSCAIGAPRFRLVKKKKKKKENNLTSSTGRLSTLGMSRSSNGGRLFRVAKFNYRIFYALRECCLDVQRERDIYIYISYT